MFYVHASGDWSRKVYNIAPLITEIKMEGPYGVAGVPLHHYNNILLVGGGIGITPMISVFRGLLEEQEAGRIFENVHLIWSVAKEEQLGSDIVHADLNVAGQPSGAVPPGLAITRSLDHSEVCVR